MSESVDAPPPTFSTRSAWWKLLGIASAALLVPGIPFLLLGEQFEAAIAQVLQTSWSPQANFLIVVVVLSADLLLPIPSSAVSTFAGNSLGVLGGIAAVWVGMTLGAIIGFALSRWAGPSLSRRLAAPRDVERLRIFGDRHGRTLLVATRPLPLLAEAAVVLAGTLRQSWKDFLLPVCLSNLAIATAYASLGHFAQSSGALIVSLIASVVVPLALTVLIGRKLDKMTADKPQ